MFDGASSVFEGRGDKGQALIGLFGDVGVVCTNRAGAGDVDVIADADGARKADNGLEGGCAWDICAGRRKGHETSLIVCGPLIKNASFLRSGGSIASWGNAVRAFFRMYTTAQ